MFLNILFGFKIAPSINCNLSKIFTNAQRLGSTTMPSRAFFSPIDSINNDPAQKLANRSVVGYKPDYRFVDSKTNGALRVDISIPALLTVFLAIVCALKEAARKRRV